MANLLEHFLKDDVGQDLTEHAILLAVIALAASALFLSSGGSISGVWNGADRQMEAAYRSASS